MTDSVQVQDAVEREAELAAQQRKIVNRLRRAQGQLAAVVTAVDSGADCRDVVIQLAAVSKALDRAGYAIVATAMRNCIVDPESESLTQEELEKLFLTLA
ncbi:metal-sensitive transcriptional regulator [Microbacterium sp. SLBN-146]|uniref:metal-sensitive transcriptional regulator n=1 Tax=Microbacterium sp. SLBN-146 TaxID=2768457 RepID=UPI00114EB7DD|nr:metal-sensitive transcriptional regulator [Microbacterium sp. SLBN-146]TQJ30324.1 DNA-binding FrmR family transcriptional regulator [Microbacterium sp. SLBN-146]